eukprot:m.108223 g.108223  ORF g.108223 m.108223 type:complete len:178 (+) comp9187_c1_seq6:848-1381(+)
MSRQLLSKSVGHFLLFFPLDEDCNNYSQFFLVELHLFRMYYNGYCDTAVMENVESSTALAASWSVFRVADGYNGHNFICGIVGIRHLPGGATYGGPYRIKIRSSYPLSVNYATIESKSCSIDCSHGSQCGGGTCAPWACRVSNCPNHKIQTQTCSGSNRYNYLSNGAENYDGNCNVP